MPIHPLNEPGVEHEWADLPAYEPPLQDQLATAREVLSQAVNPDLEATLRHMDELLRGQEPRYVPMEVTTGRRRWSVAAPPVQSIPIAWRQGDYASIVAGQYNEASPRFPGYAAEVRPPSPPQYRATFMMPELSITPPAPAATRNRYIIVNRCPCGVCNTERRRRGIRVVSARSLRYRPNVLTQFEELDCPWLADSRVCPNGH